MTSVESIGRFPDLRAAYEGAKAIAGNLTSLAHLATPDSNVEDPIDGEVIHLPTRLSQLARAVKAKAKAIRELEAELAGSNAQPIRIGKHVASNAACLA